MKCHTKKLCIYLKIFKESCPFAKQCKNFIQADVVSDSSRISGSVSSVIDGDYFSCDWCDTVHQNREPYQAHEHGFCNKECADDYIREYGIQPNE